MAGKLKRMLRREGGWQFPRGSWQYDLVCAGILAFIFLTPREFFGDQPRPPVVQQLQELSDAQGSLVFWIDAAAAATDSEEELKARLQNLLKQRTGRTLWVSDIKPAPDPDGGVRAYLVYARP